MSTHPIRRALLAVYDKSGVVGFGQALRERGVELVSSGGTAAVLREHGVEVTEVADVTGFPVRTAPTGKAAIKRSTYAREPPLITRHRGALP